MHRPAPLALALALVVGAAACASTDEPDDGAPAVAEPEGVPDRWERTPELTDAAPGAVAWRHVGMVEGMLPGQVTALAVTTEEDLAGALRAMGGADPGPVDWDRELVLLLAQPDDACPDRLVTLDAVDGAVEPGWLPPPGGCNQPLIWRVHTVVVHRGHLTGPTTFLVEEPFRGDVEIVTLDLPTYGGEVPPPPDAPAQLTTDELDAVFADHPVRLCSEVPSATAPTDDGEGDGDPSELAAEELIPWLERHPRWDLEREIVMLRDDEGRRVLRVGEDRVEELRADLAEEFGAAAPTVVGVDPSPLELRDAQDAISPLMRASGPGAIVGSGSDPVRNILEVAMVDPTREALDRIAELVDPALVCVDPQLSGVPADGPGR
jgi:hypothetical protein